jgi:hypothetical protein
MWREIDAARKSGDADEAAIDVDGGIDLITPMRSTRRNA